jgi:hypothetical protein
MYSIQRTHHCYMYIYLSSSMFTLCNWKLVHQFYWACLTMRLGDCTITSSLGPHPVLTSSLQYVIVWGTDVHGNADESVSCSLLAWIPIHVEALHLDRYSIYLHCSLVLFKVAWTGPIKSPLRLTSRLVNELTEAIENHSVYNLWFWLF